MNTYDKDNVSLEPFYCHSETSCSEKNDSSMICSSQRDSNDFAESKTSTKNIGKHMILDISGIKNMKLLENLSELSSMFDNICIKHNFTVLSRVHHEFIPIGITFLYLLSESHISFHSYPENCACFIDIFTCRLYPDNSVYNDIYSEIIQKFDADIFSRKMTIDRSIIEIKKNEVFDVDNSSDADCIIM